ncbi:2,3-diphosphoglycerate-dependent phosphoglycerate mutase [Enterobacteriaceae endosymbiont of Neohaemonia nigricornis]|uniref:2,3-diphosphoglycerate-dependent phosphoglycerate mutase n=1 Tax=Enterobacteriaceae endosymbiont of Neohaemonia nigricornis TaxID=2675792 RepID=UPI001448D4C4|nr:2,3-diphosphoglycerate-dependent phosphoglycerate mutase [Enterobacteriaceae endosymbiont of Neohaemonia nigricornis]QJC30619.1 2,3-diphosphoglycerate-dependent phosphoglycerate mutase [Enterobacteriaceae endosymbiont of Neohaemonia nigricornis]
MMSNKLVLIRHGQSQWNKENLFTGWHDVDLSEEGKIEAIEAGKILKNYNFTFDYAYTSVLKRAIYTLWLTLKELNQMWIPIIKTWQLNERHYGALQGMNKDQIAEKYGIKQVQKWRRSFNINPPELTIDDPRCPRYDSKYSKLEDYELPLTESLATTLTRVVKIWNDHIIHKINNGERVLIVAHGNSLRALIKHIEQISDNDIINLNIPTGIPIICEFNSHMQFKKRFYLNNI